MKILSKDPIIKLSVTKLCQIFQVKRDTYYKYFRPKSKKRVLENIEKERVVVAVFEENERVYGVEKLKKALDRTKFKISRRKIREIQGRLGLFPAYIRRFKQKYESGKDMRRINLLEGDFYAAFPGEKWVADITYIWQHLVHIVHR